ncbi:EexN family lipoprotein [Campylobacter coli]
MKNTIKLALLGVVITGVFSACSSEPKTVQYYEDPKNANSAQTDTECANAYKANYSKSLQNFHNEAISDEEATKYLKKK